MGDLNLDIKNIWDMYQEYAQRSGADKEVEGLQKGYSLWWFFAYLAGQPDFPENLPELIHAFFADPEDRPELLKRCAPVDKPSLPGKPKKGDHIGSNAPKGRQWAAIRAALDSPISFIQGPPGTGKTETILNLLYQIDKRGLRAAVISSNKAALDNIHSKLKELKEEGLDGGLADRVAQLGSDDRRKEFNKVQKKVKFLSVSRWCYCAGPHGKVEMSPLNGERMSKLEDWLARHPGGMVKPIRWESQLTVEDFFDAGHLAFTTTAHSLPTCFADGLCHCYDYIIVDEASQMDYLAGIVTMCHAKHLVLVGDEKQLAPVLDREALEEVERDYYADEEEALESAGDIDDERMYDEIACKVHPEDYEDFDEKIWEEWQRENKGNERWWKKMNIYRPRHERSFLDLCLEVFSPALLEGTEDIPPQTACKVFLNKHYRCRRGIIKFCNKEVYGGALRPMRKEPGVPIKILYFEGDYCQRCFQSPKQMDGKTGKPDASPSEPDALEQICREDWDYRFPPEQKPATSKVNAKQVEIFMAEELPELRRRMEKDPELTACILTPFNGELRAIQRAAKHIDGMSFSTSSAYGKRDEDILCVQSSSVHKAQGKEYDIVYLLPVEDGDWEGAFSQKQRMVNVAVSRAKEELRIITSAKYMSTKLQEELGVTHPRKGPEEEGGERFLRKLTDYVRENITPEDQAEFGFHKTALVSIFDHKEYDVDAPAGKGKNKSSAGEVQVRKTLQKLVKNKKGLELKEQVYIQTVLKQLGRTAKELPHSDIFEEYLKHKASFDFVLYEGGVPFLAVEVDGAYHRFPLIKNMSPDEPEKSEEERYQAFRRRWLLDRQKDALVREALGGQVFYGNTKRYMDEWRADEAQQEIDQWGQPTGDFALLRLPDDGTTYLETNALRATARTTATGKEVAKKVFTLEELIKRYRPTTTRAQKQK